VNMTVFLGMVAGSCFAQLFIWPDTRPELLGLLVFVGVLYLVIRLTNRPRYNARDHYDFAKLEKRLFDAYHEEDRIA